MEHIPGYDDWKTTPPEYDEPEPYYCPICGDLVEEIIYKDKESGTVIGCDRCVYTQEYWEEI